MKRVNSSNLIDSFEYALSKESKLKVIKKIKLKNNGTRWVIYKVLYSSLTHLNYLNNPIINIDRILFIRVADAKIESIEDVSNLINAFPEKWSDFKFDRSGKITNNHIWTSLAINECWKLISKNEIDNPIMSSLISNENIPFEKKKEMFMQEASSFCLTDIGNKYQLNQLIKMFEEKDYDNLASWMVGAITNYLDLYTLFFATGKWMSELGHSDSLVDLEVDNEIELLIKKGKQN